MANCTCAVCHISFGFSMESIHDHDKDKAKQHVHTLVAIYGSKIVVIVSCEDIPIIVCNK